jgi:hypothetical protein
LHFTVEGARERRVQKRAMAVGMCLKWLLYKQN